MPDRSAYLAASHIFRDGYDFEQRMVRANGVNFLYDPEGKRVARVVGGAIQTQYLYDPDGTLVAQLGADSKLVRGSQYGGGEHLADYTAGTGTGGGDTQLRTSDPVGTLAVKYDHAGNNIESCTATPFGDGMICQGPGDVYTGETHFADALREAEGKLDHFGARDYNSDLGRFNVPDPSGLAYADPTNPQSLNLYSYALNNPLDLVDPSGLSVTNLGDGCMQSTTTATVDTSLWRQCLARSGSAKRSETQHGRPLHRCRRRGKGSGSLAGCTIFTA